MKRHETIVSWRWLFSNIMVKGRSITETSMSSTGTGIWSHHCCSTLKRTFTWLICIELKVIGYLHVSLQIKFCWRDLFSSVRNCLFVLMTGPFLGSYFKSIIVNQKYYYFVQVCKLKSALLSTHGLVYFYMFVIGLL